MPANAHFVELNNTIDVQICLTLDPFEAAILSLKHKKGFGLYTVCVYFITLSVFRKMR